MSGETNSGGKGFEPPARQGQDYRTAVYGSVRTVVWEGGGCEASPYPDSAFAKGLCEIIRKKICSRNNICGWP